MTDDAPTPTFPELDALSTEELRERAFHVARERHDARFFIQVIRMLPASIDAADSIDGSLGSIGESITDLVGVWREFTGHGLGTAEPALRAEFIDYLMKHGAPR
ncbi:MAG TPA: hypothetical protein VFR11_16790 [Micromonosporaceae bacterium]|jgi:hypothetical protein|nr:hypothetical protein [Micromonosporaceae bacterium]